MDFTSAWHWPQWTVAIWLFVRFAYFASKHGEPMIVTLGEKKGQPERYSGFVTLAQSFLILFFLIAGGFFA